MADLKCPNCGTVAAGSEGKIVCATCGGTFEFVAGEAKLKDIGEVDRIKKTVERHDADLAEIKQRLPASSPALQPPEDPSGESDPPFDDDEEDEEDL